MRPALGLILRSDPAAQWARDAVHAWDFSRNVARYNRARIGPVTSTPGWSVTGTLALSARGLLVTDQLITATISDLSFPLSMFVELERVTDTGAGETALNLRTDDNNRTQLFVSPADLLGFNVRSAASNVAALTSASAASLNTVYKMAGRISTNSFQMAGNGMLGTEDTTGAVPSAPTVVQFGSQNGATFAQNYVRRAAIFDYALTDAQLQDLTR